VSRTLSVAFSFFFFADVAVDEKTTRFCGSVGLKCGGKGGVGGVTETFQKRMGHTVILRLALN
jgi:hypothetical protein